MLLDLELRFIEKHIPSIEHGYGVVRVVRVLQQRKTVQLVSTSDGAWNEVGDWEDVPFIEDPTDL